MSPQHAGLAGGRWQTCAKFPFASAFESEYVVLRMIMVERYAGIFIRRSRHSRTRPHAAPTRKYLHGGIQYGIYAIIYPVPETNVGSIYYHRSGSAGHDRLRRLSSAH